MKPLEDSTSPIHNLTPEIKNKLSKLCTNMAEAGFESFEIDRVKELINGLYQSRCQGINRFIRKLSQRILDRQDFMDIFVEGQFAVTLARNKFSKIEIEHSGKGTDVEAVYNRQTMYFEVVRRRYEKDEWAESFEFDSAKPDSSQSVVSKIQGKLRQLRDGEINIVVYWSSTLRVMLDEMVDAFAEIQQEINADAVSYRKLSGILFTEMEGYDISSLKQYYLFKNDKASRPMGSKLTRKLESLHSNLKEMQRHSRVLRAADKKLYSMSVSCPHSNSVT